MVLFGCGKSGPYISVGPGSSDFRTVLAGTYAINRTSPQDITISGGRSRIADIVVECNTDGRFIIAKRQGLRRRSPNDPKDTFEEPDPNLFDYWILDTVSEILVGPLSLDEFKTKRTELGIQTSLELKDVESFNKWKKVPNKISERTS
ncbi:MAG: hypothetical protein A2283_15870 [Lentisphaerae bacterium RIFOXYA12_FULL_48_11]|nr:MAG: hypothetical protein A2283_15870 [Lentisphaerae bacterium RIFOXYA12_FULL_48_11]